MDIVIRKYKEEDLHDMMEIWNMVVDEANAFPQLSKLTYEDAQTFFRGQSYTAVAESSGDILGLYILHPNNIGRCAHIANASYAIKKGLRGQKIGEKLVRDSLSMAKTLDFKIMQFNAVVRTNEAAIHLYEKIGFHQLGIIPGGFLNGNDSYTDIILYYIEL